MSRPTSRHLPASTAETGLGRAPVFAWQWRCRCLYRAGTSSEASAPSQSGLCPAAGHEILGQTGEECECAAQGVWSLAENDLVSPAEDLHLVRIELKLLG